MFTVNYALHFPIFLCRMSEYNQKTDDCLKESRPYFSFGVIGDVQYSPIANRLSAWKVMRYYQQSLCHLQQAIEEWSREDPLPKFVLQLGDIIDSSNRNLGKSREALETVLKDTEQSNLPFHHIWGNHELYNFNRDFLRQSKLNTSWMQDKQRSGPHESHDETSNYPDYYAYHFSPHARFCIIIVDTYDLSVFGRKADSQGYQDSMDFLDKAAEEKHNGT